MAANFRYDAGTSSPDNTAFSYPNSHRMHYSTGGVGPTLERPSGSREIHEGIGRNLSLGGAGQFYPNTSNALTHEDLPPLSQVLLLEQIAIGDSKYSKQPELRRAIAAALALIGEGHGGFQSKPIEKQSMEELKRMKNNLLENSSKARERSHVISEAIAKLDKFRASVQARKRARIEARAHERPLVSVSGERPVPNTNATISSSKSTFCESPSHVNMVEGNMPKFEDKIKGPSFNKRVRTSMLDARLDNRVNIPSVQRSSTLSEQDRGYTKSGGSLGIIDDKDRVAAPSGEPWEKSKTKGRRSTKSDCGLTVSGVSDIEREHRWGAQHRSTIENKPKSIESHSFRSGPVHGVVSMHKSGMRNEPDNAAASGGKESRFVVSDKERPTSTSKSAVKVAHKEEGLPTTVKKVKSVRAPRTGIAVISGASHAPRASAGEVWDCTSPAGAPNRAQVSVGPNNRKRSALGMSSSSPVAQWVGQRPHKISRVARRMNLVGPTGTGGIRDETVTKSEPAITHESANACPRSTPSSSPITNLVKRGNNNAVISQIKTKNNRLPSAGGESESEDSEGTDMNSKEKWKKQADPEGRLAPINQKMAPLFLQGKKSRVGTRDEGAEGIRRQGRSGRVMIAVRESLDMTPIEKGDLCANAVQLRSARPGTDKMDKSIDVKLGRPSTKKSCTGDRKSLSRHKKASSCTVGEVLGESDDDHEELIAAVQAAVNSSASACSSLFWKEMEPFFAYLTPVARNTVKLQISERQFEDEEMLPSLTSDSKLEKDTHELTAVGRPSYLSDGSMDPNGGVLSKLLSTNDDYSIDSSKAVSYGVWPIVKELPLSQKLLAALIIEDDIVDSGREGHKDQLGLQGFGDGGSSHDFSDSEQAGLEKEQDSESEVEIKKSSTEKLNGQAKCSSNDVSCNSNGHRHWDSDSELLNSPVKSEVRIEEEKLSSDTNELTKWEGRYQSLTLDERIALELQSLGLYPDQELHKRDDNQITEEITRSQLKLKELVHMNKEKLSALDEVVTSAKVFEDRERERLALTKLLENAFNKRLGIRGGHLGVSGGKITAVRAGQAAALVTAKRSLARWKHYVATEETCFTETGLREILFCISSVEGDSKSLLSARGTQIGTNNVGLTFPGSSELKLAASPGTRWVCHGIGMEVLDKNIHGSDQLVVGTPSEQAADKDESWCIRSKERELLLEDVGGSGGLGNISCGTKGKRSERERDGSTGKGNGRQALGSIKGERKTKTKPRQKTAPLLKAVNGLLGKPSDVSEKPDTSVKQDNLQTQMGNAETHTQGEVAIDLSSMQLLGMDDLVVNDDLGGQGLESWLDDPGLLDAGGDLMGLDVPMDDLADLSMIM
ncbi:hypothetical protein KP509_34G015100 [Ceratopteris richardii]|uniref:Uncharacterized protein n=1 Tax=Ceratopteris richardii TaxID=49495 RepID=A0A8T2QIJ2_CERRI|nr:hypothetical protein KP509_34G015100 [Ceratopteris richardii]